MSFRKIPGIIFKRSKDRNNRTIYHAWSNSEPSKTYTVKLSDCPCHIPMEGIWVLLTVGNQNHVEEAVSIINDVFQTKTVNGSVGVLVDFEKIDLKTYYNTYFGRISDENEVIRNAGQNARYNGYIVYENNRSGNLVWKISSMHPAPIMKESIPEKQQTDYEDADRIRRPNSNQSHRSYTRQSNDREAYRSVPQNRDDSNYYGWQNRDTEERRGRYDEPDVRLSQPSQSSRYEEHRPLEQFSGRTLHSDSTPRAEVYRGHPSPDPQRGHKNDIRRNVPYSPPRPLVEMSRTSDQNKYEDRYRPSFDGRDGYSRETANYSSDYPRRQDDGRYNERDEHARRPYNESPVREFNRLSVTDMQKNTNGGSHNSNYEERRNRVEENVSRLPDRYQPYAPDGRREYPEQTERHTHYEPPIQDRRQYENEEHHGRFYKETPTNGGNYQHNTADAPSRNQERQDLDREQRYDYQGLADMRNGATASDGRVGRSDMEETNRKVPVTSSQNIHEERRDLNQERRDQIYAAMKLELEVETLKAKIENYKKLLRMTFTDVERCVDIFDFFNNNPEINKRFRQMDIEQFDEMVDLHKKYQDPDFCDNIVAEFET